MGVVLVGNCYGGELSWWQVVLVKWGILPVGNRPSGDLS